LELLVVIAIMGVLCALVTAAAGQVKARGWDIACRGNLRQLGLLVRLYADENDGRLPQYTITDWSRNFRGQLQGAVTLRSEIFHCRADKATEAGSDRSSYVWNPVLNGKILHRIPSGTGTAARSEFEVLLSDREPWHGHRNGVFSDGHVGKTSNKGTQ
jgi:hypothetical protein